MSAPEQTSSSLSSSLPQCLVGIIGGTGIHKMASGTDSSEIVVYTPYGTIKVVIETVGGVLCAFISRHGEGHQCQPSDVNFRGNIFALKLLGVQYILSICACGSLKEEFAPGDLVLVDDFIDRTYKRASTFFEQGVVGHISFAAAPCCPVLSKIVKEASASVPELKDIKIHEGGTYLCMEGPAFSTRAESIMYKNWGASLIGMTAIPEAKLAMEAEIPICVIGCITDYDAWRAHDETVTVADVMKVLAQNVRNATSLILPFAKLVAERTPKCPAHDALAYALTTSKDKIPQPVKEKLGPILKKYL